MNLTWHIVGKDLRRMARPVAAWLAFVVIAAGWFNAAHMPANAVAAHELDRWIWGVGAFAAWAVGMQVVTSVLLAAHLLLDDPVRGTTAFWQTRPITRGRMLGAKLIAGAVLLVVAPAVGLLPVWLAGGFSVGETLGAAGEFAAWQAAIVVMTLGLASLTNSLAQFFFSAVGVAVAYVIAATPASGTWWGRDLGVDVERSRQLLTLLAPVPGLAIVLIFQSLTRRTRDGWILVVAGLIAIHAVRVAWPYDVMRSLPGSRGKTPAVAARGEDAAGAIAVNRIVTPFNRSLPHAVFLTVEGRPLSEGLLAPESGTLTLRLSDQRGAGVTLDFGGFWGEDAAKRLAGFKRDEGPVDWGMAGHVTGVHEIEAAREATLESGSMQFARMHGRVLAELPLVAESRARTGSSRLRIVGLGDSASYEQPCVVVEERDSLFMSDVGLTSGRSGRRADRTRQDAYLLVNRALGIFKGLHIVELGSVNLGSVLVSTRQLEFSYPEKIENGRRVELPGWRDGAVLIKVRFELERRVMREIAGGKVALVAEEEKP